jgi:excisionase family DNA binding protein
MKGRMIVGYKVPEAAGMLRVSENEIRELIARGECPARRVGRLIRIPPKEFHERFGEAVFIQAEPANRTTTESSKG